MRKRSALVPLLASATFASAQPAPPPEQAAPPSEQPAPPGVLPPITINITNNNNGNNSNTNTQTNNQTNDQANHQTAPPWVGAPPALTAPLAPPSIVERYHTHREAQRWLLVGAMRSLHGHGDGGAAASLDLLARGNFSAGLGLAADREHGAAGDGYFAWTGRLGPLDVRAEAGVGVSREQRHHSGRLGMREAPPSDALARTVGGTTGTTGTTTGTPTDGDHDRHRGGRASAFGEAALLVGLPLGRHLGVVAGPIATSGERSVDVTLFAGLRYRL